MCRMCENGAATGGPRITMMTADEAIFKMLEQVLRNQIEILVWAMDPQRHNAKSIEKSVTETILLLEKVTK